MKIASFTPIWNAELFIKPHFDMFSCLEKNVVFYNPTPWKEYCDFHYESKPDNSIDMIRKFYPKVQIIETGKVGYQELVPMAMEILKDYDVITRLDVDMLLTKKDLTQLIDFITNNRFTAYFTKWSKHTINYYADFEHGLHDAEEQDPIFLPTKPPVIEYEIDWDGWMIHHFRGWNKPKSIKKGWDAQDNFRKAHDKFGPWVSCPQEIRDMFDPLLVERWFNTLK